MSPDPSVVISCEHASNAIPAALRKFFSGKERLLRSHRAYDIGARYFARDTARALGVEVHTAGVSRLVCDCNRSPGHPALFSSVIRELPEDVRGSILNRYYWPYRHELVDEITRHGGMDHAVVHLSIHSFTPVLKDRRRKAEIGLLFDPARAGERLLAEGIRRHLIGPIPDLKLRNNYPYRGTSDGMTSALRRIFSEARYLGLEIELNQQLWLENRRRWTLVSKVFADTLTEVLSEASFI